ncbi:MAG: DUF167 domain-containing protein [Patescibacteria group bacterium]
MKLFVKAKPGARQQKVEQLDDTHFVVAVCEPPVQGQANAAIIKALADFLHIAPSRLRIVAGHTSRQKIIDILTN